MDQYNVNVVQSGEEEDYIWVSLHFASSTTDEDRIHIVCSTFVDEQDERLGMDSIYLERLDQSQGGYGVTPEIRVTPSTIEFDFTSQGLELLGFAGSLQLIWSATLEGYEQARQHLVSMSSNECGKVIQYA